ncbi:hypothetical protein F511_17161 [Dorcoceras hygrometricum]|uniref:Retrotransposon gag domain-containing protein n=1 Tax=Dorcoceras hygrometricum TaxID=472368 RepID=A0A2Z7C2Y2_9LAMI|nr:hypothetical protein F511_17161 [Dorcoceras hygrometricum]
MVDRIEGHPHGHAIAKQTAEPQDEILEKNVVDMEEASKMMAEGILAYVKAVVSHTTQSSSQGSLQHKGVEKGVGSSRAGETRRSVPTHPAMEERYTPSHRRDEPVYQRSPVIARGNGSGNSRPHLQQPYGVTNPVNQPALYDESVGFPTGNTGFNIENGAYQARGSQFYNHPLQNRNAGVINFDMVRETVQELYGPALRLIGRPEFHKPYPEIIDHNNPYPRGYKIPDFNLFSGEYGQSTVEHIARFTIKCGILENLENFANLKLRLFPNTLTSTAFTWYTLLPRNSVFTWQEME